MIIKSQPLSLPEVKDLVKTLDKDKPISVYLKKFPSLDSKKAEDLRKKIKDLDNLKIKDSHIVKIIDFLPKDAEDLGKIFTDVSLSEEEINKILEITKAF